MAQQTKFKTPLNQSNLNQYVKDKIETFSTWLGSKSKTFIIVLSLFILAAVAFLNVVTHEKLSFSVFYLIPICLVSWYTTRYIGLFLSLLSAVSLTFSHYDLILSWKQWVAHLWNTAGTLCFYILMVFLLRLFKGRLEDEKKMATIDHLTNIPNRREFLKNLKIEIDRSRRYKHPMSLAFIDLDNFKEVNDNQGHQVGDFLLQTVAKRLEEITRSCDTISRFGGDEFSVLLPETGENQIQQAVHRIKKELMSAMNEYYWPVTFSIGVATYKTPPESVDEIIHAADSLMYRVKKSGKNGIEFEVVK